MIGVSGGTWAAAVQRAGALGFIAAGHLLDTDALERQVALYKEQMESDEPFLALGFIGHSATAASVEAWQRYEYVLDRYRPDVVQFFAPAITRHPTDTSITNIGLAHEYGSKFMAQVGNVASGRQALQEGVDCLVAQGTEAGGHGLRPPLGRALLPLLTDLKAMTVREYPEVPVLAAGGLTTGGTAAAALCAGADGVALGTRLWASAEALGHDSYKRALVTADSCDDTLRTTVVDQLQNHYVTCPWPQPYDSLGVLRNRLTDEWDGRSEALAQALGSSTCPTTAYRQAVAEGNVQDGAVLTGQGVGSIHSIDRVADILATVEREMIESMDNLADKFS